MKIRQATTLDAGFIYELNKECLPIYYTVFEHIYYLMSSSNLVLVVENDTNEIIGYLIGEYKPDNFHIGSFGITEKYRGKGIGKMVIDYLVDNCDKKYKDITLNVHDLNDKGIRFYKKNKFNIVKRLNNYYDGCLDSVSQSAYFMRRIL